MNTIFKQFQMKFSCLVISPVAHYPYWPITKWIFAPTKLLPKKVFLHKMADMDIKIIFLSDLLSSVINFEPKIHTFAENVLTLLRVYLFNANLLRKCTYFQQLAIFRAIIQLAIFRGVLKNILTKP